MNCNFCQGALRCPGIVPKIAENSCMKGRMAKLDSKRRCESAGGLTLLKVVYDMYEYPLVMSSSLRHGASSF